VGTKQTLEASLAAGFALVLSASSQAQTGSIPSSALVAAQSAVCRPQFTVDATSYEAGTAFIIGSQHPVLMSAQHLFGPEGGLKAAIPWQDMPKRASSVSCKQIRSAAQWSTGPAIAVEGAHPMSPDDQSGSVNDVAVFSFAGKNPTASPLSLAAKAPTVGTKVWLVAQIEGAGQGATLLHAATVIGAQNGAMLFSYDDPKIDLDATSGAPLVDATGKVVGLNLGGGFDPESKAVVGVADDLEVISKALVAAKSD
jgi:hypothetical protein